VSFRHRRHHAWKIRRPYNSRQVTKKKRERDFKLANDSFQSRLKKEKGKNKEGATLRKIPPDPRKNKTAGPGREKEEEGSSLPHLD